MLLEVVLRAVVAQCAIVECAMRFLGCALRYCKSRFVLLETVVL